MKHKKANPLPEKGKNTKPLSENRKNDKPLPDPKTDAQRPKRRRWQRILTLLCLLGFLMFFFPVFGGILDLANSSAMLGFLLLAVIFWFWPGFLRLLRRIWKKTWGKIFLLLTGTGLTALVLLILVLSGLVISGMTKKPSSDCPAVLVLGCQVRGTVPSLLLSYRIQVAADYLNSHPEAVAVVSGGQGPGEDITEAECMMQGLVRRGVDPQRILKEDQSTLTLGNLRFSKAILEKEGIPGPVLIVSNDFHLYRALKMAEDEGIEAQGLPARSAWYSYPTYILREALALIKYGLTS